MFVDTNYFLCFLLGDIPDQQQKVNNLFFAAAEGKEQLNGYQFKGGNIDESHL